MMLAYVSSLLQPWRRVSRAEFVIALTLLSLPGLGLLFGGFISGAAGTMGPLADLQHNLTLAQQGSGEALTNLTQSFGQISPLGTPAGPQVNVLALANGLCLLLLTPFLRGRLLDIGYSATASTLAAWVLQLSVIDDTLASLMGHKILPMGWILGLLTMGGYLWLTLRPSKPKVPVYERLKHPKNRADGDDYPNHHL